VGLYLTLRPAMCKPQATLSLGYYFVLASHPGFLRKSFKRTWADYPLIKKFRLQ